jgi:pseudaminic acid cytidylyltransferase
MGNLCIIPARGGSKRIPRKNIKEFMGKPIIAYPIELALKSGLFAEVMVSTDDEEISAISKYYGAKVPFTRSDSTSDDFATTASVIEEVITKFKLSGVNFDSICCLYPCTPLLSIDNIVNAHKILINSGADSVIPVVEFEYPIQRSLQINEGKIQFSHPDNALTRTQDLEKYYHDAGQFYWMKADIFMENQNIFTNNSQFIILSHFECHDIDNELDWKLAELKFKLKQSEP